MRVELRNSPRSARRLPNGHRVALHRASPEEQGADESDRWSLCCIPSIGLALAEAWVKGPGPAPPVLLQVRLGGEGTKHGFEPRKRVAAVGGHDCVTGVDRCADS